MKSIHRVASHTTVIGFLLITIPMVLSAQTLSQVLDAQTERTLISQSSQERVDKIVQQTRSLEDKYRASLKEIEGLLIYNQLLDLQIENQERVMIDLEKSIVMVSVINRQIVPVMTRMIESLEQFISLEIGRAHV